MPKFNRPTPEQYAAHMADTNNEVLLRQRLDACRWYLARLEGDDRAAQEFYQGSIARQREAIKVIEAKLAN